MQENTIWNDRMELLKSKSMDAAGKDIFVYSGKQVKQMTIKEIARLAGVSSAAVSRYMNGGYVSAEKKEQIRQIIEKTGYRPCAQARTLRTKRTCLAGVIIPKLNSESISRVVEGIGRELSENGYQMLLGISENQAAKELAYLELFESHPVDGILLAAAEITKQHLDKIKKLNIPVVVIGQKTKGLHCVYHDDFGAAKELAEYLAEARTDGTGKIAYIGADRRDRAVGADRQDGFQAGLQAKGYAADLLEYRVAEFSRESGFRQTCSILEKEPGIRVIACATDTIAAGAVEAVRQAGLENNIQIAGFGDNQFLRAVTGGIITVHFHYRQSGICGAQMLLGQLEKPGQKELEKKLGYELVKPQISER